MPIDLAKIKSFQDGLDHPAAVAVHADGSVWAGGEAGQVYRLDAEGTSREVVGSTGGFVTGLAFSPDGSWLAIADGARKAVFRLDLAGFRLGPFAQTVDTERTVAHFISPNALAFAGDGALYMSDAGTRGRPTGRLFRFDAAGTGKGRRWHAGPFAFPAGLALAPDGGALYVACTWLPGIERIAIKKDGSPGKREVFVALPDALPTGLAFDAKGNLLVTSYAPARVLQVSPDKDVSVLADDPTAHTLAGPRALAFGGKELRSLFIANAAQWHVARADAPTKGHPLPHLGKVGV